jgi:hypothetical protein
MRKNHTRFEMSAAKAKISRVQNGAVSTLFEAPLNQKSSSTRLSVNAHDDVLSVSRGEEIIAQASGANLTKGKFGLLSRGPRSQGFSDAVIYFAPPPERPKVAPRMQDDAYMVGWASASGEWPPTPGPGGLEFWNTGAYFGDANLEFSWRASWRGRFEIAIRAQRGQFDSGYLLRGAASEDKLSIDWSLVRGDKELAKATTKIADLPGGETPEGAKIQLALTGQSLLLSSTKGPLLSYLDSKPPTGNALAVRSSGFRVRADRLRATSANRDDYTFTEAPTDFYAPSGAWSVFSRWPCYGDWSFFGGAGRNPVLWTKRQYSGDVVAEFYAHPQMDLPKEPGYSHPADLNLTIAGDGLNVASGYSFVVAGHDNTRTQILKGNKVVAERSDERARFQNTINNSERWHRKWFYVRGEAKRAQKDGKSGVMVSLTLDEDRLLEWFDADPLPSFEKGGRVAMWTVDNTLMIARAKIEAEHMGARSLPAALLDANRSPVSAPSSAPLAPVAVVEDGAATALVDEDAGKWRITNPAAGGVFSVDLTRQILEATPQTKFSFDAQIPDGTKIDLYVLVDEQWHTIEVTGAQKPDALAPLLGRAASSKNASGFSTFTFDIGAALAKEFPGEKSWKIDKLRLGALHGNQYRWVGFDGNTTGASYRLGALNWK